MIKAIIIDDIPQAIELLKGDLENYCPDVEVIGDAPSVVAGTKLLKQLKPDIVFLDIELQDGTGFDILEILGDIPFKIIFTTASDEHAIKAFRFSAIDYLLKPINPEELQEAVAKFKDSKGDSKESIDLLLDNVKERKGPRKLALHTLDKIQVAEINEIVRCESSGNYTTFYFADKQKILVTRTLKEYEKLLEEYGFIRVHQSHLINGNHIKEYIKTEGGYLVMKDGSHVSVSIRKKPMLVKLLDRL
ncbi:MAG: two-component system LytT family response regulator [Saprospiraceae bacterium]|jgi:two-component system LytT family response regulator